MVARARLSRLWPSCLFSVIWAALAVETEFDLLEYGTQGLLCPGSADCLKLMAVEASIYLKLECRRKCACVACGKRATGLWMLFVSPSSCDSLRHLHVQGSLFHPQLAPLSFAPFSLALSVSLVFVLALCRLKWPIPPLFCCFSSAVNLETA